jgi:hypothetical protein
MNERAPFDGVCPFCGEGKGTDIFQFDLPGLKNHFERGWCEVYNEVSWENPSGKPSSDAASVANPVVEQEK